jgi:hypothetical protein
MTRPSHCVRSALICRRMVCLAFAWTGSLLAAARPVHAQPLSIVAGTVSGFAAGGWTTIAAFIARARMGSFVFDHTEDVTRLRIETLPVFLFPVAGAFLGGSPARLRATGAGAGLGFVGGGVVGIVIGTVVSDTPEGKWAGGIIGSAAGMLLGAVIGATTAKPGDGAQPGEPAGPTFSISIPLGGG